MGLLNYPQGQARAAVVDPAGSAYGGGLEPVAEARSYRRRASSASQASATTVPTGRYHSEPMPTAVPSGHPQRRRVSRPASAASQARPSRTKARPKWRGSRPTAETSRLQGPSRPPPTYVPVSRLRVPSTSTNPPVDSAITTRATLSAMAANSDPAGRLRARRSASAPGQHEGELQRHVRVHRRDGDPGRADPEIAHRE